MLVLGIDMCLYRAKIHIFIMKFKIQNSKFLADTCYYLLLTKDSANFKSFSLVTTFW